MKKFLEDLRRELVKRNMKENDIGEILADHEEMIKTALAEGLDEAEIRSRFGDPEKLAAELAANPGDSPKTDPSGFNVWASFGLAPEPLQITVQLISEDFSIQTTQGEEIRVLYTGEGKIEKYQLEYVPGELTLKSPKTPGSWGIFGSHKTLDFLIEIPAGQKIQGMNFTGVSGDAQIHGLAADKLVLNTTSGDLVADKIVAVTAKWNTVSGDLRVENSQFGDVDSSQISGDLFLGNVVITGTTVIGTVSGDANLENCAAVDCEVHSVSGDINATEFYPKSLSLKSVSGDIVIHNKIQTQIDIKQKKTVSGEITITL